MDTAERAVRILHLLRRCGSYLHHRWNDGKAGQALTLRMLDGYGELTQRQLQDLIGIQQSSLSEQVKKLEEQGLVAREQDPKDRRQVLIRLTEKGRAQERCSQERRREQGLTLVKGLSEEEQCQLLALLSKLLEQWNGPEEATEGKCPGSCPGREKEAQQT